MEPIILPLPISISQLMRGMVLGTGIGPEFINNNINHSNNLKNPYIHCTQALTLKPD